MNKPSRKPFRSFGSISISVGFALAGAAACGVAEHPHADAGLTDTSCDFGCPQGGTGTTPLPTAGNSTTGGSFSPPPGGGGSTMTGAGGTGFGTAGSGVSSGGTPVSGAGAPATAGTSSAGTSSAGTSSAGGAPPSGSTINLGGTEVPSDHVIGFIHIGHSNMGGRATSPAASKAYHYTETNPRAWMYHPGMSPMAAHEPSAIEPLSAGDFQGGGPGTALVKQAADLAPNYHFISLGFGKGSAYCSQFLPGALYYDQLIKGPKAIKGHITFGAIFIYLGITERHGTDADRAGFSQCINKLVTAIRTDVGVPDLPVLMNDYEVQATGELAVGGAVYNGIYPQIQMCPTVVSNLALVSCAAPLGMQDDHHFNFDGHKTWTARALMMMQQKGWFKWN